MIAILPMSDMAAAAAALPLCAAARAGAPAPDVSLDAAWIGGVRVRARHVSGFSQALYIQHRDAQRLWAPRSRFAGTEQSGITAVIDSGAIQILILTRAGHEVP
jgi:hypothetical protein